MAGVQQQQQRQQRQQQQQPASSQPQLDADEEQLETVWQMVRAGGQVSGQMSDLMRSVDGRLAQLERDVTDVHRTTTHLQLVHNNIDAVLQSIDRKLAVFDTAAGVDDLIRGGLRGAQTPDTYLEGLDRVAEAMNFLSRNKHFKSAASALSQLRELRDVGVEQCEQLFASLLVRHTLPIEPSNYGCITPPPPLPPGAAAAAVATPAADSNASSTATAGGGKMSAPSSSAVPSAAAGGNETLKPSDSEAAVHADSAEDEFALIRAAGVSEMKRIVARFAALSASKYVGDYAEKRVKAINSALRRLSPDKMINAADTAGGGTTGTGTAAATAQHLLATTATAHQQQQQPQQLPQQQHAFAACLEFYLRLVQQEASLVEQLIEPRHADRCLSLIVDKTAALLLETADSITILKKSTDKGFGVFVLLELWSRCSNLVEQNHQLLLVDDEKHYLRLSAMVNDFGDGADKCLDDFEAYVKADSGGAKQLPPDGTVHELTSNSCIFLKRLYDYRVPLQELKAGGSASRASTFASTAAAGSGSKGGAGQGNNSTSAAAAISDFAVRVLNELKDNLTAKARREKKQTLANIFLLNNFHYIQKTVRNSTLWNLVVPGSAMMSLTKELERSINEQRDIYKASWKTALDFIQDVDSIKIKDRAKLSSKEKDSLKSKFKGFNAEMQELFHTQRVYFIPDVELRRMIRLDIQHIIVQPYARFYDSFASLPFSKNQGKYVTYSKETLQGMLGKFFEGSTA